MPDTKKKKIKYSIKSQSEVFNILEKIFLGRTHLGLNQEINDIVRSSWSLIKNINPHSFDMAIRPKNNLNQFNFSSQSQITVNTESNSVLFDVNLKKINHKNLIIVEFPKELELLSTRNSERYEFKNMNFPIIYKNLTVKSYQKRNRILKARLDEISNNGISYTIPYEKDLGFSYGDKITIHTLNNFSLPKALQGKIVFLQDPSKTDLSSNNLITKIGVKFNKQIDLSSIMRYLNTGPYFIKNCA